TLNSSHCRSDDDIEASACSSEAGLRQPKARTHAVVIAKMASLATGVPLNSQTVSSPRVAYRATCTRSGTRAVRTLFRDRIGMLTRSDPGPSASVSRAGFHLAGNRISQ